MKQYPLKFVPIYKERLWGGQKLQKVLNKDVEGENIGESWEISTVPGDISVVSNGIFKGISLKQLITTYKETLVGKKVYEAFGDMFPILIKFIDAKLDLSIQLHPNDALAKERHDSFGKTEMWYVMQADHDAELIVGFNKDVTKKEYRGHLETNTLSDILNVEKVGKGDTYFINVGKVHAIGGGVLLAEIQQTSDVTYRIYDWNRKDKNGNTRELHTELALDAIDYTKKDDFKIAYSNRKNRLNEMVSCPYFTTEHISIDHHMLTIDNKTRDSFVIYMCTEGSCTIATVDGEETIKAGETILIPAVVRSISISAQKAKLLQVYL